MLIASVFLASPIYADAITDGISSAGDAVYSYTTYVQNCTKKEVDTTTNAYFSSIPIFFYYF